MALMILSPMHYSETFRIMRSAVQTPKQKRREFLPSHVFQTIASVTYIEHCYNYDIYTVYLAKNYIIVIIAANASVVKRWISSTLYFNCYFVDQERLVVGLGV
ncbi:hypothetical protein GmHk_15G044802 [Glycine max]|nr:hypothetical protein GmHk_15G044802 [Glycine max]